jgi:hypothetical protein
MRPGGQIRPTTHFVVCTAYAAAVTFLIISSRAPITLSALGLAVLLASLSIAYSLYTERAEGARYALNQRRALAMSNMLGTWTFPAAILLPPLLSVVVIVVASIVQWRVKNFDGTASAYRYAYSCTAVVLSAFAAHAIMGLPVPYLLSLSVAAVGYALSNGALITLAAISASGIRAIRPFLRPASHLNELRTVAIGAAGVLMWQANLPLLWLTLPLVIGLQRLAIRSESRQADTGLAAPMTEKVWGTVAREVVKACATASIIRVNADDPAVARSIAQMQAGCDAIGAVGASGLVVLLADCPGPNAESLALRLRSAQSGGGVSARVAVAAKPRDRQVQEDQQAVAQAELITRDAATRSARSLRPEA